MAAAWDRSVRAVAPAVPGIADGPALRVPCTRDLRGTCSSTQLRSFRGNLRKR